MNTHDNLNKELGGSMVEARMAVGLRHSVKLTKKSTRQTTRL